MTVRRIIAYSLLLGYFVGGAWALCDLQFSFRELADAWPFFALGIIGLIGVFKNI